MGDIPSAIEDADSAVQVARRLDDPPVLIDALALHLDIEGNDALLGEARSSVNRVIQAVPDERLRQRFLAAENVQRIVSR